jgi:hypothetical protein
MVDTRVVLPFRVEALYDLYGIQNKEERKGIDEIIETQAHSRQLNLQDIEFLISSNSFTSTSKFRNYSRTICHDKGFYSWTLRFIDNKLERPRYDIVQTKSDNLFYREFGTDRFVEVVLKDSKDLCDIIVKHGIHFGCQHYEFLGGKPNEKNKKKKTSLSSGGLRLWFIASDKPNEWNNLISPVTSSGMFCQETVLKRNLGRYGYEASNARIVYEFLGKFGSYEHGLFITNNFKLNSRLQLGFSTTTASLFKLQSHQVILRNDIKGRNENGNENENDMTDGCGFISVNNSSSY